MNIGNIEKKYVKFLIENLSNIYPIGKVRVRLAEFKNTYGFFKRRRKTVYIYINKLFDFNAFVYGLLKVWTDVLFDGKQKYSNKWGIVYSRLRRLENKLLVEYCIKTMPKYLSRIKKDLESLNLRKRKRLLNKMAKTDFLMYMIIRESLNKGRI